MKTPLITPASRVALACAALAAIRSASALLAAVEPDYRATAERIVGQSAGVKADDRVVLRGDVRDIALLEEMALAVYRRGAEPLQVVTRELAARRYFDAVPESHDARPLSLSLKLAEVQTVEITITGSEHADLLSDVPAARRSAIDARNLQAYQARLQRGVRLVGVGNGLYPTDATAKRFGITREQLAQLFWDGVNVDYARLRRIGEAVRAAFVGGTQVRITHPNGTDLTCRIQGRTTHVSNGVISAEDVAKGPPATQAWLPAGEVYVVPVRGTAGGRIVFAWVPFEDGGIEAMTLTFKAGRLVSHTAKPGPAYEQWKKLYAAAAAGKDEFAFVDVGINPNVKPPAGSKLATWVPAGTITIGIGNNLWAGGENAVVWDFPAFLIGGSLAVDGKLVVERGALKEVGANPAAASR